MSRRSRVGRFLKTFYVKSYEDNLTGLSGMVAYNLLLSLLPFALLALFIASRLLKSPDLEASIFQDLTRLFPSVAESTITSALSRVQASSTSFGVIALVTSIWFGSSFWGSLDTAFCRIYHMECRSWLRQKRFAVAMLVVVLLFIAATVAIPAAQSILVKGAADLPFGLAELGGVLFVLTLAASLVLLFAILCVIYWAVPNRRRMPWRAIWPGALTATFAIGIVDYAFPLYLNNISTLARFGTTLVFIAIVLIWFYVLSIILLGGAVINAARLELHETGELSVGNG